MLFALPCVCAVMSMYYGMSLPFDASHMNGMLTSSLYSSSTTPTHLSQQQQQPLALPLSLAPSMGSTVTLQQYQQLLVLQQLQQQQQQLEAANARSPAGDDSSVQQNHQRLLQRQQLRQQQQQQQQHSSSRSNTSAPLISHGASSLSPLSSPAHAATSPSLPSQASSTASSSAAQRFNQYTDVTEAMNDGEYVTMLAERWRSGGYEGQSLRQLAVDDLAERRRARRRYPHPLSTSALSPSSSALAASALAQSSGSSPLRPLHTPLRPSGYGSSSASHLAVPTPSSFLASHFNFSPLSPSNNVSPTATTPASLLSPGRDGLGPLFSPSRFYASPADGHGKQAKKRMRDSDMTLLPLNLNTDDDEQQQQHPPQRQQQQPRTGLSTYTHRQSAVHGDMNGHSTAEGDDSIEHRASDEQFVDVSPNKRVAGGSGDIDSNTSRIGNKATQQRPFKKQEAAVGNRRAHSRKAKQPRDESQQKSSKSDNKRRERPHSAHSATNGATSASFSSLNPFPVSNSLATPMRLSRPDPHFSLHDGSRLSVDAPSVFSPLQTPQRPAAPHNQFFSETPQHSFTHLFSPGPALFGSSSSHFPSPAAFVGMTPATPERKHRNRLAAASPIQLLLPSPLSSPAPATEHQPLYDSNNSSKRDSGNDNNRTHAEKPSASSHSSSVVSSVGSDEAALFGTTNGGRGKSLTSPSASPGLAPLTFPGTPTPLDKRTARQDGSHYFSLAHNGTQPVQDGHNHSARSGAADTESSAQFNVASPKSSSPSSEPSAAAAASIFSPAPPSSRFEPLHDMGNVDVGASPYRMALSLPMSLSSQFATPSVPARHRSATLLLSSPSSASSDTAALRPPSNASSADTPIAQSTPSQLLPLRPATPNTERANSHGSSVKRSEWDDINQQDKEQQRVQLAVPEPMMIA